MNEPVAEEWFLIVRDAERELRVVARNAEPVDFRRMGSVLRGPRYRAATELIAECSDTRGVAAGHGYAAAVVGSDESTVHGFLLSLESPQPAGVPSIGTWTWSFPGAETPPVLRFSAEAMDLLGVALDHRDRTLFGPADFFTRTDRFADILTHSSFLYDAPVGSRRSARTAFRGDDGQARDLYVCEVVDEDENNRFIRGMAWGAEHPEPRQRSIDHADTDLALLLANNSNQLVLIGDLRFPATPYVLKWVTPHPPGIGHGASTGQTPGIHPEDLGKLIEYIMLLGTLAADDPVPELTDLRVRKAGGGWMAGRGRGFRLDPEHFPTIWVALVSEMG